MKISYNHILKNIESNPDIQEISSKLFQLGHEHEVQDNIFDIEVTPNRGDCLSLKGILRDLSIFYEIDKAEHIYQNNIKNFDLNFENYAQSDCPDISFLKVVIDGDVHEYTSELENYFSQYRDAPSIFAIGFFEGLGSTNIIPETVVLKGTFRAMNEKFRKISHEKMKTIAAKIASKHSAKINFDIINGYPFLVNDIAFTNKNICLAKKYLGEKNVVELPIRMTAEDFAYYSHILPSCFYRLGIRNKDKGIIHGLHTSRFDIDEQALKIGMGMMAFLAINS